MSTHLYCVLPHQFLRAAPPQLSGVGGGRVRALPVDGFVAWVSDVERGVPITIDGVKAHDAVVEAALDTGSTPVPARYGQRFESDDACREAIERRAESVETLLTSVQGFVEMTLILTPSTRRMIKDLEPLLPDMAAEHGRGIGRKYLESLRARETATNAIRQALDALGQRLTDAAHAFILRSAVHEQLAKPSFRTLSHLIRRQTIDQYRDAVKLVHPSRDYRFLLVGPRAPYSFCALGADGGGNHGMRLGD